MPRGGSRRTYVRDGNGRFASSPGGGTPKRPPAKRVSRGTNRLTRDNSGRITGAGKNGATARGGRLRTAAGNLRATQTDRLKGAPKGVVSRAGKGRGAKAKPAPRATATSRLRPGELMNAVARPVNTMAKPKKGENPYQAGIADQRYRISARNDDKKARMENAKAVKAAFESKGLPVKYESSRVSGTVASYNPTTNQITINRSHVDWVNPAASAIRSRRTGEMSSSAPMHVFYHELGHVRDKNLASRARLFGGDSWPMLTQRDHQRRWLARRVSRYATTSPAEFIAETYAGLKTGRRYDFQVMRAYREAMGLSPNPAARRRSRVRRPKP